jgi:hypothetical protein
MKISLTKNINFKYFYKFEFAKQFKWSLGVNPQYWYQVTGCCKDASSSEDLDSDGSPDVCPPINTNQNCKNKSQYFQVILADSVENVCQTLIDNNWEWKICDLRRWSKPAENEYVDPFNDCNQLEEVTWQEIPECFLLNMGQQILDIFNFNMSVKICCQGKNCDDSSCSSINSLFKKESIVYEDTIEVNSIDSDVDFFVQENLRFKMDVSVVSISFSETFSNQYKPTFNNVIVSCKNCSGLSNILYVDNNLLNLNYFSSFLFKNDYELSDEAPLLYNKTTNIWSNIFNYRDKFNSDYWKIFFSFGCTGELDSDFYYWKFSMNITKTNNIETKETRMLVSIPSDFVCKYSKDYILSFEYNLFTKYLFINYESYYDNFYFVDNIGLFNSSYWSNNPKIKINVTQGKIKSRINRKTINYN